MEGLTPTIVLCGLACFILGSVSLILLVVSIGLFFANRFNQKLFAFAVFGGLAAPAFLSLPEISQESYGPMILLSASCFLVAASGQLNAAFRGNYPTALACSLASAAFQYGFLDGYAESQLRRDLFVVPCVLFAVASVVASFCLPPRVHTALKLVLVNLVLFDLAVMFYAKESYSGHRENHGDISLKYQLVDLRDNTHWNWVLAATVFFVPSSIALFTFRPKFSRRRFLVISAVILFLTAQWITGQYGALRTRGVLTLAAGPYVFDDFTPYAIAPGWIRCNYMRGKWDWKNPRLVDPNPQFFKDDIFWYAFGQTRLRHVELPAPEKKPFKGWPGFRLEERQKSPNLMMPRGGGQQLGP